ncbi:ATP-binding protein [Pedobacter metabolipauper]|uniref:histidine kinase n=1 Tax=Pedobacter metabolipauper TaxID=425513 RepID=A0A4R6T0S4_9SPHI|nr:ATP-binding protein [Pedobacter metabolipauper]TDQ11080.1 light-regulated signal transduction histidine kinase (bacteriophytochrome) [Pedobacter metabolipauper]
MNNYQVDLTNCDKEPIHIPGKVQSHGFLIAISSLTFQVTYVSENVTEFLDLSAVKILDMDASALGAFFSKDGEDIDLGQLLKLGKSQNSFDIINPYKFRIKDEPYYLIIHQSADDFVLEFEQITLEYDIQNIIGRSISQILTNKSLIGLLSNAAQEVKNIIEYDRVMIYRFLDDGHGEVVAEVKNEDLEPFFGLHYPASDIPKQARELYKLNYTRIIADVETTSSAIATYILDKPLDLTNSGLRAVSPIHIQYLKNMGVASSFSISLMANGELWGLIACHNYSPKFIDYKAREGAKLIGQILSSALEYRQGEEDTEKSNLLNEAVQDLSGYLEKDPDLISALTRHKVSLLDVTHSSGVAFFYEKQLYTMGQTPAIDDLNELCRWLKQTMQESVYHTHQLPEVYKPARDYADLASGILACMLSKELGELIIWFKPEQIETINWAGNPEKPAEPDVDGNIILSPRHSFESWAQIVKNTSSRWRGSEISGVLKLRERVLAAIHKKANEIRILNERLKLAYDELDTFSYTISHDLRTPLTSIKSYTELFLAQNKELDEKGKKLLDRVVSGADKMAFLINEILKLARVGRSDIQFATINAQKLVQEITLEVISALNAPHVKVVVGDCPDLTGDQTLITQVFTNLISNAIKYSEKSPDPEVYIEGKLVGDEVIYSIKDNGIGIDVNYHDKVFELFKRMDNVRDYEGTGVGLAIVKRIIERHNGRIWFESELKVGTVFYIAFKK